LTVEIEAILRNEELAALLETAEAAGQLRHAELQEILEPLELDPLTVADDHDFLDTIDSEPNLPSYLAPGLRALYPS
jgi:hypothetical protein